MKGYRTIAFNALMLVGGLAGAELDPTLVDRFLEAFMAVWAAGNGVLRAITNGPIFDKGA